MRGVYRRIDLTSVDAYGSSPLAWGIQTKGRKCYNGTTVHPHLRGVYYYSYVKQSILTTVHPHLRGVYYMTPAQIVAVLAVHPHLRGVY